MNKITGIVTGVVAGVSLVVALLGFYRPLELTVNTSPVVGAQSGPEHYNPQIFYDTVSLRGAITASSSLTVQGALELRSTTTFSGAISQTNCGTALYTIPALQGYSPSSSTVDRSVASTTVTTTKTTINSLVWAHVASTSLAEIMINARMTAANTASVYFQNMSASAVAAHTSSNTVIVYCSN